MNDLTRWNRAGLTRFRYIDGNAATFLEDLRLALLSGFIPNGDGKSDDWQWWRDLWAEIPTDPVFRPTDLVLQGYRDKLTWQDLWQSLPATAETPDKREERLLALYRGPRRDFGWEIQRALARALHVLTEHIDAYANEGYLGTATQWDNLRRLVEMLDYHPAPPASAETWLAIEAKQAGSLAEGFQLKYAPADGGAPLFFETLADVDLNPALNELRARDWDRSQVEVTGNSLVLEGKLEGPIIGDPVVIEKEPDVSPTGPDGPIIGDPVVFEVPNASLTALKGPIIDDIADLQKDLDASLIEPEKPSLPIVAWTVAGLTPGEQSTRLLLSGMLASEDDLKKGTTWINLAPKDRLTLVGPLASQAQPLDRLRLQTEPRDLNPHEILHIEDGSNRPQYRALKVVDGTDLTLAINLAPLDITKATVSRARIETNLSWLGNTKVKVPGDLTRLLDKAVAGLVNGSIQEGTITHVIYTKEEPGMQGWFSTLTLSEGLNNATRLFLPPTTREWVVDSFLKLDGSGNPPLTIRTTPPKKLSANDLVVLKAGSDLAWGRVRSVSVDSDDIASITVFGWKKRGSRPWYAASSSVLGHFKTRVRLSDWQNNTQPLASPVNITSAGVKAGMSLILEGPAEARLVTVTDVAKQAMHFSPVPPADEGYSLHNSLFRGNLAKAGQGKSKPEKVLGSGDAARTNQSFLFQEKDVAFQTDLTFPVGVKAAIQVRIGVETWVQVPNLRNSGPADSHYSVAMTEEGFLKISFGDGRHGRRLPTGTNNVRIAYRVGSGLAGNLAAASLVKPSKPHWLVEKVRQPMAAAGGGEMEPVESLRENAPATVLTLARAVSLRDFSALLEARSNIWQAHATRLPPLRGSSEIIELVVVPAGGGPLGEAVRELGDYVRAHATPGVTVRLRDYEEAPFNLHATVRVKTDQFDPDLVRETLGAALTTTFSLQNRKLGQSLYLSEVYQVVEGITGVENSHCILEADGNLKTIKPNTWEVALLKPAGLRIDIEEYGL